MYLDDDPYANSRTGGLTNWLGNWGKKKPLVTNFNETGGGGRRVLVTGGGGSIGQDLVRRLLQEKYRVTIIDSQNMTSRQLLHLIHPTAHIVATTSRQRTFHTDVSPVSWYSSSKPDTAALTFYQGDIRDEAFISMLLPSKLSKNSKTVPGKHHAYSGIFHLAGVSRESWCKERETACHEVNVKGTENIVSAIQRITAAGGKAPWTIVTSSLEVYGDATSASVPKTPSTALGRTKLAMEQLLRERSDTMSAPVLVMRPSLVYGANQDIADRLLPSLVRNALIDLPVQVVDGKQRFDMLYIQDLIQAFLDGIDFLQHRSKSEPVVEEPVTEADVDVVDSTSVETSEIGGQLLTTRAPGDFAGFYEVDVLSGYTATIADVAAMVMSLSRSSSPVQTFETGSPLVNMGLLHLDENIILKAKPAVNLVAGVTQYIDQMRVAFVQYAKDYLTAQCPSSKYGDPSMISEADRRNEHIERLSDCSIEIGVKNEAFLHYVKCGGGSAVKGEGTYSDDCLTNVEKVPSMKWNSSVFIIREADKGQFPLQRRQRRSLSGFTSKRNKLRSALASRCP